MAVSKQHQFFLYMEEKMMLKKGLIGSASGQSELLFRHPSPSSNYSVVSHTA